MAKSMKAMKAKKANTVPAAPTPKAMQAKRDQSKAAPKLDLMVVHLLSDNHYFEI